jgi:hypothetical protein
MRDQGLKMGSLQVDRLSLRLSGLSPEEGQRLARLIAERLGTGAYVGLRTGTLAGTGKRARVDSIQVQAAAQPGSDLDRLASQIAEQVLRELGRSL